jgi:hypothetical protein
MKTLILLLGVAMLSGCFSRREIQVEVISAQLVRIDTIHRFQGEDIPKKQLTWRDNQNTEYISFASMHDSYPIGTTMSVFRSR